MHSRGSVTGPHISKELDRGGSRGSGNTGEVVQATRVWRVGGSVCFVLHLVSYRPRHRQGARQGWVGGRLGGPGRGERHVEERSAGDAGCAVGRVSRSIVQCGRGNIPGLG